MNRKSIDSHVINDSEQDIDGYRHYLIALDVDKNIIYAGQLDVSVAAGQIVKVASEVDLAIDEATDIILLAFLVAPGGEVIDVDFLKRPADC